MGQGAPSRSGRERRAHEEQIEARAREGFLPSFGALRRDKTPTAASCLYLILLESERMVVLRVSNGPNPFYVRMGLPFIV